MEPDISLRILQPHHRGSERDLDKMLSKFTKGSIATFGSALVVFVILLPTMHANKVDIRGNSNNISSSQINKMPNSSTSVDDSKTRSNKQENESFYAIAATLLSRHNLIAKPNEISNSTITSSRNVSAAPVVGGSLARETGAIHTILINSTTTTTAATLVKSQIESPTSETQLKHSILAMPLDNSTGINSLSSGSMKNRTKFGEFHLMRSPVRDKAPLRNKTLDLKPLRLKKHFMNIKLSSVNETNPGISRNQSMKFKLSPKSNAFLKDVKARRRSHQSRSKSLAIDGQKDNNTGNLTTSESLNHEDWITFDRPPNSVMESASDPSDWESEVDMHPPDNVFPMGRRQTIAERSPGIFQSSPTLDSSSQVMDRGKIDTRPKVTIKKGFSSSQEDKQPIVSSSVSSSTTIGDGNKGTEVISKSVPLAPELRRKIIDEFVKNGGNPQNVVVSDSTITTTSRSKKKTITTVYHVAHEDITSKPKLNINSKMKHSLGVNKLGLEEGDEVGEGPQNHLNSFDTHSETDHGESDEDGDSEDFDFGPKFPDEKSRSRITSGGVKEAQLYFDDEPTNGGLAPILGGLRPKRLMGLMRSSLPPPTSANIGLNGGSEGGELGAFYQGPHQSLLAERGPAKSLNERTSVGLGRRKSSKSSEAKVSVESPKKEAAPSVKSSDESETNTPNIGVKKEPQTSIADQQVARPSSSSDDPQTGNGDTKQAEEVESEEKTGAKSEAVEEAEVEVNQANEKSGGHARAGNVVGEKESSSKGREETQGSPEGRAKKQLQDKERQSEGGEQSEEPTGKTDTSLAKEPSNTTRQLRRPNSRDEPSASGLRAAKGKPTKRQEESSGGSDAEAERQTRHMTSSARSTSPRGKLAAQARGRPVNKSLGSGNKQIDSLEQLKMLVKTANSSSPTPIVGQKRVGSKVAPITEQQSKRAPKVAGKEAKAVGQKFETGSAGKRSPADLMRQKKLKGGISKETEGKFESSVKATKKQDSLTSGRDQQSPEKSPKTHDIMMLIDFGPARRPSIDFASLSSSSSQRVRVEPEVAPRKAATSGRATHNSGWQPIYAMAAAAAAAAAVATANPSGSFGLLGPHRAFGRVNTPSNPFSAPFSVGPMAPQLMGPAQMHLGGLTSPLMMMPPSLSVPLPAYINPPPMPLASGQIALQTERSQHVAPGPPQSMPILPGESASTNRLVEEVIEELARAPSSSPLGDSTQAKHYPGFSRRQLAQEAPAQSHQLHLPAPATGSGQVSSPRSSREQSHRRLIEEAQAESEAEGEGEPDGEGEGQAISVRPQTSFGSATTAQRDLNDSKFTARMFENFNNSP